MTLPYGMKAAARRYAETNNVPFTDFVRWLNWKTESSEISSGFRTAINILIGKFLSELRDIHSKGGKK